MEIREKFEMYFNLVEDNRQVSHIKYKLSDILFLLMCSTLCGCNDIEMILEFAEERLDFFTKHTELEELPCAKTILNILRIVKPERLELCLHGILRNIFEQDVKPKEKQICIDGKTVASTATMKDYDKPLHIIAALLADEGISLGQIAINSKSNEIPAVRELLDTLDIKNAIITMDALHCQKETIEKVIDNGGDYVVQLKGNQVNFYQDVYTMFDDRYMDQADKDCEYEIFSSLEKSHGRIEQRTCYVLNEVEFFTDCARRS